MTTLAIVELTALVIGATLLWPVNRWAMRRAARPESLGVVISGTAFSIGVSLAWVTRRDILVPMALLFGALGSIAYAIGFNLIIFYCLKIGPAGPTVTLNNLGLLWPVSVSMIWFSDGKRPSPLVLIGIGTTILALALTAWNRAQGYDKTPITTRWARWALLGWVFAGISMTCQFLAGRYVPDNPFPYMVSVYGLSFVILAVTSVMKGSGWPRRDEIIAGITSGVLVSFLMPVTLLLLGQTDAAIVFPITVATPVVLMLLIGHFLLKERLNLAGWIAGTLGVVGIVVLSLAGNG